MLGETFSTLMIQKLAYFLSPPQRLPLGIPIKIAIIENSKRKRDNGKREKVGLASSLFPSHRALAFFLSPASLRHKEVSAEEKGVHHEGSK